MHTRKTFRRLPSPLAVLAAISLIAGCATVAPPAPEHEAMLLVSLQDGSIIEQSIEIDADVCIKQNEETLTTCYIRRAPIYDGAGRKIIGYQMERKQIQLIPKSERPQIL